MIPCLANRKDAALHAQLGSRQNLVVCWVRIHVSALVISRNGNETLPCRRRFSLVHLRAAHPPGVGLSLLPTPPLRRCQTLPKEADPAAVPVRLRGSGWVPGGGAALACCWNGSARDLPGISQQRVDSPGGAIYL